MILLVSLKEAEGLRRGKDLSGSATSTSSAGSLIEYFAVYPFSY